MKDVKKEVLMEDKGLESIDTNRCQAEIKEGSFMTFGPRCYIRCDKKASWIGIDVREGKFYGAMSFCDDCKKVCEIQMSSVRFQKLSA